MTAKSPFDWRGPTLLDWTPAGMTGNKYAAKTGRTRTPTNSPWQNNPATEGGRKYLDEKGNGVVVHSARPPRVTKASDKF